MGIASFPSSSSGGWGLSNTTFTKWNGSGGLSIAAGNQADLITINGSGVCTELQVYIGNKTFHVILEIDGVEKHITDPLLNNVYGVLQAGYSDHITTAAVSSIVRLSTPIRYNSKIVVRLRNVSTGTTSAYPQALLVTQT